MRQQWTQHRQALNQLDEDEDTEHELARTRALRLAREEQAMERRLQELMATVGSDTDWYCEPGPQGMASEYLVHAETGERWQLHSADNGLGVSMEGEVMVFWAVDDDGEVRRFNLPALGTGTRPSAINVKESESEGLVVALDGLKLAEGAGLVTADRQVGGGDCK